MRKKVAIKTRSCIVMHFVDIIIIALCNINKIIITTKIVITIIVITIIVITIIVITIIVITYDNSNTK